MVAFYKHDIASWMDGTEQLSAGAYRAYHTIVQLIYLNEGPITLNERGIAGRCNMSTRGFRTALRQLLDSKKLTLVSGKLANIRAEKELELVDANRENAAKGGRASGKARINKDLPEAPLNMERSLRDKTRLDSNKSADALSLASELAKVLDTEHTTAVIEHRKKKRAPLTAHAAKLLAGKFAKCQDPNAAADAMIANGWQGFEPEWMERSRISSGAKNLPPGVRANGDGFYITPGSEPFGRWKAWADKNNNDNDLYWKFRRAEREGTEVHVTSLWPRIGA